jgi:hypothetical protein
MNLPITLVSHEGSRRVTKGHEGSRRVTKGHEGSRRITKGHEGSRRITKGHEGSRRVTKGHEKDPWPTNKKIKMSFYYLNPKHPVSKYKPIYRISEPAQSKPASISCPVFKSYYETDYKNETLDHSKTDTAPFWPGQDHYDQGYDYIKNRQCIPPSFEYKNMTNKDTKVKLTGDIITEDNVCEKIGVYEILNDILGPDLSNIVCIYAYGINPYNIIQTSYLAHNYTDNTSFIDMNYNIR